MSSKELSIERSIVGQKIVVLFEIGSKKSRINFKDNVSN